LPQVLEELRSGTIHLTGLFLLAHHLTQENYEAVMSEARGQSKRQIEQLIAARAPKPDVPQRLCQLPEQALLASTVPTNGQGATAICPGTGPAPGPGASGVAAAVPGKLAPLSPSRWLVQFTASAELRQKIEKARELLSHALPSGDLANLFERALDELIERETKRRLGAGKPRQRRPLAPGSRHVPVEVARQVWQRDGYQCTFTDTQGRRCSSRRFLTLEHRQPFALGGAPSVDNLCLLCASHNAHSARQVFGEARIAASRAKRRARSELAQESWQWVLPRGLVQHGLCRKRSTRCSSRNYHKPQLAKTSSRASKQLWNCLCRVPRRRTSTVPMHTASGVLTELQTQ
jgi:hypothetical protein